MVGTLDQVHVLVLGRCAGEEVIAHPLLPARVPATICKGWVRKVAPGSSESHFAEAQTPLASDSERPLVSGARKYETTKPTAVMAAMISIVAPSP